MNVDQVYRSEQIRSLIADVGMTCSSDALAWSCAWMILALEATD